MRGARIRKERSGSVKVTKVAKYEHRSTEGGLGGDARVVVEVVPSCEGLGDELEVGGFAGGRRRGCEEREGGGGVR